MAGLATKKTTFFEALKKNSPKNVATKLERGGGVKALAAGPVKNRESDWSQLLSKQKFCLIPIALIFKTPK